MKELIAAAALAAAGTSASAAVYEYDLTVQATSVDAYYDSVEVGQIGSGGFSLSIEEGENRGLLQSCSFFGISCPGGAVTRIVDFGTDGGIASLYATDGLTEELRINLSNLEVEYQTALGGPSEMTTDTFRADILDSDFTVDGVDITPVPIPASGALLIAGVGGLAAWRRRPSSR